jgi:hypothetical protein
MGTIEALWSAMEQITNHSDNNMLAITTVCLLILAKVVD